MNKYLKKTLNLCFDQRIFTPNSLGALNYGIIHSLTQLVANSLDWRQLSEKEITAYKKLKKSNTESFSRFIETYGNLLEIKPEETTIFIRYNNDSIEIWDNGLGMTLRELENALKLGAANDKKREPIRMRKGIFGMGLVLGILNIGWEFIIRTRSIFEEKEYLINIDTRQIETEVLKLDNIGVDLFPSHDTNGPLKNYKSGTYIQIRNLLEKKHQPEIWRQELGRIFSSDIENEGVKIIIIDNSLGENIKLEPCTPEVIDIISESKVQLEPLNLVIEPEYGEYKEPIKIRGWLALRRVSASGSGRWGINTYYKGQLIEAFHNDGPENNGLLPFNPHPTFGRLCGEIHLDMCMPSFTKIGWNRKLKSWEKVRDILRVILEQMMKASREYRFSRKNKT